MADFSNYRDQEKQRRGLLVGAALGIGAALAFPAVRRGAATILLGGVGSLGRKFGSSLSPLRIQSVAAELEGLVGRGLTEAARASLATAAAERQLTASVSELSAIHARELATSTAFRRFLNTGVRQDLSRAMRDEEVQAILGRHAAEVRRMSPSDAIDTIIRRRGTLIEEAMSRVQRPTLQEAALNKTTLEARGAITRLAGEHLENRAQVGMLDRFLGAFGVKRATLNDLSAANLKGLGIDPEAIAGVRSTLQKYAGKDVVGNLPVGSIFMVGGREVDLRGAENLTNRFQRWFNANIQIPISPGMGGIAPGQLFPWRRGRITRSFATAQQFGKDPVGRALLGSTTDRLGLDVFKVGDKFLGVNFAENSVNTLNIEADLYTGLYGAMKRRSMAVNAAQAARAGGISNFTDLFLNRNWRHTEIGERLSVITKFRDPRWAPNIVKRVLGGDLSSIATEDLERLGNFLQAKGLPTNIQERLASQATFGNPVLQAHARNMMTEEGLLGFFNLASQDQDILNSLKSGRLKSALRQYQTSPSSTIGRIRPSVDYNSMTAGILGIRGDKSGIDLMREALSDEFVARMTAGGTGPEFIEWLTSEGLTGGRAGSQALAYGHGRVLLSSLRKPQGIIEATNYLRDNPDVRDAVGRFVRGNVGLLDKFRVPDNNLLNTAELIIPKGRNPAVDIITAVNNARKAGESPLNAIVNVAKSPTIGQYTAFFTGNQADVTATTVAMEFIPRRLEQWFQVSGLGLPDRDLLSGGSILSNLMLKRILPVVGAYELYRYSDYKLHQAGLSGPSDIYANIRSRVGLERARLTGGNFLGLGRRELFPGLERLIPNRTVEEEAEFQQTGYEPVRKGRFWLLGSRTQFLGDKIQYFLPSSVKVARSRWQEAENVDLNTADYWKHSLLPLPENKFLGPLHWLFSNKYWYERKHSMGPNADRPAILSGELSDPYAFHGPIVNATIGRLLKPRRVIHPEFLPKSMGGSATREQLRSLNEAQKQGLDIRGIGLLTSGGGLGGRAIGGGTGIGSPGIVGNSGIAPIDQGSLAVITPGGQLAPLSMSSEMTPEQWAQLGRSTRPGEGGSARLSRREIARINRATKAGIGGLTKIRPSSVIRMYDQREPFSDEDLDLLNYHSGTIQMAENISDIAGLYGFLGRTAARMAGFPIEQKGKILSSVGSAYGFARRLHDLGLGSFGEGTTEVFRRFVGTPQRQDIYNPVPNMMPGWLPGPEYITDFRHGDPYSAIPRGEIRLPGEAYERTHNVRMLQSRASSIGKSVEEIMQQMLFIEQPLSDSGAEATEVGTAMHRTLQRRWKRMGILVGAEESLYNPDLGISGHYDAILRTDAGNLLVDIKTVNERRFAEAKRRPFAEHVSQVNYYLNEMQMSRGAVIYVNRDRPWEIETKYINFDPGLFRRDVNKIKEARRRILELVNTGVLTRGDLYDPISRIEILGDVAPYSENYAAIRQYLTEKNKAGDLTQEENVRFQAVKKRVAAQKRTVETVPYRFSNMNLDYQNVTVDAILDPNTILIRGSDNPIRLAGGRISNARIIEQYGEAPEGMTPAEWMYENLGIHKGTSLQVALEGDPKRRIADDVLRTQHAVIFRGGRNINRELIESGVATEKETDYSDTGVLARFTPGEIRKGGIWERFAHMDTFFNTKFLRVRSPLEELERGIVFGKNTGSWQHPIRDYVSPTITSYLSKNNLLVAGASMGAFASFFMRTRRGKAMAFAGGAIAGLVGNLARRGYEGLTGETWKPARTRRREELEEYWDILKYVKYRGLAAQEEALARKEEGVDIEQMSRDLFQEGEARARKRNWLEKRKRELIISGAREGVDNSEEIGKMQDEIEGAQEQQGILKLGPHATRALQYRELYRSTLYGIDPGTTPFLNMFRAFPKYKRELIQGWIEKSDERERERIYRLLPEQEQRVIGKYLGVEEDQLPERPLLREYFKNHPLPGPDWEGWAAEPDLEKMRQIAIKNERLDPQESGINDRQIEDSEREVGNIPIPTLRGRGVDIQKRLNEVLSGRGLKNVRVSVDVSPHDGDRDQLNVEVNLKHRREKDIADALALT